MSRVPCPLHAADPPCVRTHCTARTTAVSRDSLPEQRAGPRGMPMGYEAASVREGPRFGKIDGEPPRTRSPGEEERAMSQAHPSGPSVIEQLASYASRENFAKLPEATVRAARRAILD